MGILDLFKKKSVPAVSAIDEHTRDGLHKAFIPKFLYKPPFGYPRFVDLVTIRRLAAMPYVEMCISTIVDEICAVPWDIIPIEDKETESTQEHIDQVKNFYLNPNTNKESFEEIRRKYIRDILEVDAGVINKVFNQGGQMVEIVARDGVTFTKNPDIFGMFTDREDLILQPEIISTSKKIPTTEIGVPGFITAADAREKAAYFQYGWISGARPVPFGKREIIWFERNPRTDDLYGRSAIQNLAETIQTLIYAIEHNLEYFNDNSIPKGVLGLEGSDATEIEAFKEQWTEQQRVKDSAGNWKKKFHQIPIVGKTPNFTRFQLTNSELELLEGQKWWAKMVWACFGVTSVELGYTEDSKGLANQIVQSNVFKKRSINPLLRIEEYKHNHEIISEFEFDDVEFKFLLFDVEEETKKAQLYKLQIDAGYKSINEIRLAEGLEEVEWGNKMSEEEKFNMNNQFDSEDGSMQGEENNQKKKVEKEKEILQGKKEQKAELKYKYIKRTGGPGNYTYWYRSPTGKLVGGKKPEEELEITKNLTVDELEEIKAKMCGGKGMNSWREIKENNENIQEYADVGSLGEANKILSFTTSEKKSAKIDQDVTQKYFKEKYGNDVELYRGVNNWEKSSDRAGQLVSWTIHKETAENFADRKGGKIISKIMKIKNIIASSQTHSGFNRTEEHEFLVYEK